MTGRPSGGAQRRPAAANSRWNSCGTPPSSCPLELVWPKKPYRSSATPRSDERCWRFEPAPGRRVSRYDAAARVVEVVESLGLRPVEDPAPLEATR